MKWGHRGHEFDEYGKNFTEGKRKLIFYGINNSIMDVFKRIAFLKCDIMFADERLVNQTFMGRTVISLSQAMTELKKNDSILIIFEYKSEKRQQLDMQLTLGNYRRNVDFFYADEFIKYLPVFCLYAYDKCYVEFVGHAPNWGCTLKCEKCSMCIPYLKKANPTVGQLKAEIDLLFSKVDYVQTYDCTGGETFLVSDKLAEVLFYLFENYGGKFGCVQLVSNGTVIPTPYMFSLLSKYKNSIRILVSCYDVLPGWNEKLEAFRQAFEKYGCSFELVRNGAWIDFAYQTTNLTLSDSEMTDYFDSCGDTCRLYMDGKYYYCSHGQGAKMAFYPELQEDGEVLDFRDDRLTAKEIIEYNYGFSKNGYLSICRHCNGWSFNKCVIPVAEQIPRHCNRTEQMSEQPYKVRGK